MNQKIEKDWKPNNFNILNDMRLKFLDYLNLDLNNKKVLEMSCGATGWLSSYLYNKKSILTITDSRIENIRYNISKNKLDNINYKIVDYDMKESITEKYNIIFCFGLLYHLNNIENVIKNIGKNCKEYCLISTCVSRNNRESRQYNDNKSNTTQAMNGIGLSFSRETLIKELKKYFKYVLVPYYLPNDPNNYPIQWPVPKGRLFKRQIFLATNNKICVDEKKFSYKLLDKYKYLE